jgi:hypothetical protein
MGQATSLLIYNLMEDFVVQRVSLRKLHKDQPEQHVTKDKRVRIRLRSDKTRGKYLAPQDSHAETSIDLAELDRQYTTLFAPTTERSMYTHSLHVAYNDDTPYYAVGLGILTSFVYTPDVSAMNFYITEISSTCSDIFRVVLEDLSTKRTELRRDEQLRRIYALTPLEVAEPMKGVLLEDRRAVRSSSFNSALMQLYSNKFNLAILIWTDEGPRAFFPTTERKERPVIIHLRCEDRRNYYVLIPRAFSSYLPMNNPLHSSDPIPVSVSDAVLYPTSPHFIKEVHKCEEVMVEAVSSIASPVIQSLVDNEDKVEAFKALKLPELSFIRMSCSHFVRTDFLKSAMQETTEELLINTEFEDAEDIRCSVCNQVVGSFDKLKVLGVEAYKILQGVEQRRVAHVIHYNLVQCYECEAYKNSEALDTLTNECLNCISLKIHMKAQVPASSKTLLETKTKGKCANHRCTFSVLYTDPVACSRNCMVCLKCCRDNIDTGCIACSRKFASGTKRKIEQAYPACRRCKEKLMRANRNCRCLCVKCATKSAVCSFCGERPRQ